MDTKIHSFTDLNAWKEGHRLVLQIYDFTSRFPAKEQFGLSNQMQRAVVSITSNVAEGFSRGTSKDKSNFYRMALGSLTEVQNHLLISRDLKYIPNAEFLTAADQTVIVSKLINGLIKGVSRSGNP